MAIFNTARPKPRLASLVMILLRRQRAGDHGMSRAGLDIRLDVTFRAFSSSNAITVGTRWQVLHRHDLVPPIAQRACTHLCGCMSALRKQSFPFEKMSCLMLETIAIKIAADATRFAIVLSQSVGKQTSCCQRTWRILKAVIDIYWPCFGLSSSK